MNIRKSLSHLGIIAILLSVPFLPTDALGQKTSRESKTNKTSRTNAIKYDVDLSDARNHYLTITATIPADGDTTELMMAVWTPGSYLVREYARHIDTMEIMSNGKHLEFEKSRKNRWLVQTKGVGSFQVKYHLYCNEMTVRTNWVGKQYAMINGAPTYITVADRLEDAHEVRLIMPRGWTRSATSLRSAGDSPHVFRANNFDELVDSPIVAGNINVYPFMVGGVEHQLVNVGESGYWDGAKAATDLKRIVEANHKMWGVVPYDRYLFLNMICESGGGLEHDNCTVIMTSRWSFRDAGRYQGWLSIASHEFFHTWNVRRLRPKSLVKYDYENEVYTDSLWIAEGITSYYQELLLERAGFYGQSEYLGRLSRDVESVQRTHGRKLQSLKDSSYDAWIKYYRPDENSSITRISYYSKGAVAAFLLDARIRRSTGGKKSLDDLMRKMFSDFSKSGYTTEEFRDTASDIAGEDLTAWFVSNIDSTDDLDFSDIEFIGIVDPDPKPTDDVDQPIVSNQKKSKSKTKPKTKNKNAAQSNDSKQSKGKKKAKDQDKSKDKKKPARKTAGKKKVKAQEPGSAKAKSTGKKKPKSRTSKSDSASKKSARSKPSVKSKSSAKKASPTVPKSKSTLRSVFSLFQSRFGGDQKPAPKGSRWIGLSASGSDGVVKVSGITPYSPAYDAGINLEDEVIAVDGFRVTRNVSSRLSQFQIGDEIELLISRRGKLMTFRITIGSRTSTSSRLRFNSRPSDDQEKQKNLWLDAG